MKCIAIGDVFITPEMIKTAKRYILQNNEWFEFIGRCECLEPLFYELLVAEKIKNEEV